jgi:hypothetical protein
VVGARVQDLATGYFFLDFFLSFLSFFLDFLSSFFFAIAGLLPMWSGGPIWPEVRGVHGHPDMAVPPPSGGFGE